MSVLVVRCVLCAYSEIERVSVVVRDVCLYWDREGECA